MGEYLSRRFAPLPVTKGTRITGGLFYDVDEPMIVIGLLVTGDVVARIIGSHVVHILKDVEWYEIPRNREPNEWNGKKVTRFRDDLIG